PVGQGLNTILQIVLDGSASGGAGPGLVAAADNVRIQGLVVHRWSAAAIRLAGPNGIVTGNFIGTTADGLDLPSTGSGQLSHGVEITGLSSRVGGTSPADRNVISGMNFSGVLLNASNNLVQGNLIAMKANGMETLPDIGSGSAGVTALSGIANTVGGAGPGSQNVFGNPVTGISIEGSADVTILGNLFGTDVTGQRAIVQ